MGLHLHVGALDADDDSLRRYCQAGEFPVLALTAAHLSGDLSLLRRQAGRRWPPSCDRPRSGRRCSRVNASRRASNRR